MRVRTSLMPPPFPRSIRMPLLPDDTLGKQLRYLPSTASLFLFCNAMSATWLPEDCDGQNEPHQCGMDSEANARSAAKELWLESERVSLLPCRSRVLVLMCCEFKRKLGWIAWIGTETQTADRTGILTSPDASTFPVCHHRFEADFLGRHTEILH
jgi:hypothetical protein